MVSIMGKKYACLTGFLGATQDRFANYGEPKTLEEKFQIASNVKSCSGLEMVYPSDFKNVENVKVLLKKYNLKVAIINVNVKGEDKFRYGSFTSPDAVVRKEAVNYMKAAMDLAADFGCNMITSAFLNDGSDYPFQLEYISAWNYAVEAVREAADYRKDIKISLEYKECEPRVHVFLNNAGKTAFFCEKVGRDNVGVTVDTGHSLLSYESPAEVLAFLHTTGRLFYIHVNDNLRNWDLDMIPGTVNLWDMLECVFYMKKINYDGWITADVFPQRLDVVKTFSETFDWMDMLYTMVDRMDEKEVEDAINNKDVFAIQAMMKRMILK